MNIEKYKNYMHVKKKYIKNTKISGNIFSNSRFKCALIIIHGKEFGYDLEFNSF